MLVLRAAKMIKQPRLGDNDGNSWKLVEVDRFRRNVMKYDQDSEWLHHGHDEKLEVLFKLVFGFLNFLTARPLTEMGR